MSHLSPGLMPVYNSLSDKHLAGYFSNTRIRRHLQRAGLITRSGRIVPDKEYRHKLIQRAHQRHVRECLAQAIFHKVLEMERLHQIEIKRKLEESARRERVHRIKVECSKRYEEDIIRILSPRPPMGSRSNWKQHSGPEREHSESSESPSSSRPNTAPGKMQRPVRLEPIHSNSTTASFRRSSPYRIHESSQENQPLNSTMDKFRRNLTAKEVYHGVSPYCLPVINNFVTPVPPVAKKNDRGVKVIPSSTVRGRRLRPTTASSGAVVNPPWLRISVYQSRVRVNMVYFGKTVHLSNDLIDTRDDVRVFQQHCGGENLCVYKWKLREGDAFQFISRRHRGFPFSLTFYLNGLQVERLSSCCEFKHRKGSRLGGRHGHFGFSSVEGASPCYKCIIAMGLDKKPTPPPKRLKGDQSREQSATSLKDEPEMEAYRTREGAASHLERESCQAPKMETTIKEQPAHVETKVRDDYEEDFEADDEGPVEEATSQEKSPSLFSETEKKDQEPDAFEAEDEEDDDKRSYSGSSMSGSDEEETDSETTKHSEDYEKEDKAKENDQSEAAAHASDKHELKSVETAATGVKSASVNNSDLLHSAGDSTGIEISDTSIPTGNENKLSDDSPEDKNVEVLGHEIKNEDEQERAKSVQEKLAVAILKEFQCCSEPELSDTSTEEEEGPADNAPEKEKQEQLQTLAEVKSHEESVTNEVVEEQIEFKEPEEKKDTDLDNGENTQEQRTSEDGEHEKAAEDETRTEGDKSEEPAEEQLPVDGEKVAQDDKIEYSFEGSELADVDASHNDKEKVAKGAAEPDSQHNETGQIAKRREKDESSVLEPSEEANEAAVPDIAEAEAGATSETMETKAESLEEQEALSCEEAPETATEKIQTDSEEARIATEYSSRSLEECGDSTVEKTADMHLETQSSNHEILVGKKQQASGTEEGEDDSQQENCGVKEESVEVNETAEKQSQTNLERTEAENKAEEINDGNKVDESIEQNKNPPERTECEEIPDEESKNEIIENEKDAKGVRAESEISWGEAEAMVDDKSQAGEEGSETNKALREKDDEEGMSVNAEKHKVEEIKTNEECEGTTKNSVAEERETSEITEDPEKSQDADLYMQKVKMSSEKIADSENISESKEADGTKMHEPTHVVAEGKTGEREAETESEREIEAENGESSFAAEREPREDEENALTADKERQIDEPDDEIKSTDVEEVAVESGDNVKKQEDGLTDQALETGITESNAKEADGSMVKYDEAVNRDSEPETPGAEIQEWRKGNEKAKAVEDENKESNLIQNNVESDTDEVSHLGEISLTQTAADVEETANQEDEGKLESITDKPLETGENGEDTEEASKASEEGASVLLKPRAKNTEAEDVVGEGTPEDLARDDNTDMVTNWIQMHQTSRFFETFVEPLEDLRNEAPNAQVSTPNGEEKESANLLRPESPTKMERMSGNKETEESRDETQIKAQDSHGEVDQRENDPAEGELQGSEETDKKSLEVNKEPDQRDSRGSHGDDEVSQEGNTAFTTEVETFSDSLKAERDFENQSSGNVNSGPGLIVKQAATDLQFKPEQSNSQNEQKDTGNTWDNIGRDGRQITQITNFTTSHSADGSQKESHDEDVQTEMLEQQFSGETRDMQLIEDIKHTLSKEPLSTFSLFGHTSYPLLTTSGSDGGQ